jgi:GH25 family lysozyme M1 (1,4-beta-N-acetylmuramidase)
LIVPDFYEGNAEPSFVRLRFNGVRLVGLKASEGYTFVDSTVKARAKRARNAGLRRLFYHFARPDLHPSGAISEADHFVSVVAPMLRSSDYLALDFETRNGKLAGKAHTDWARAFNHRVQRRTGKWPLFYANPDMIGFLNPAIPIGGGLWLAAYGPNDGKQHAVSAPHPWKHIKLHQFTSQGRITGATHPTDLSSGTL